MPQVLAPSTNNHPGCSVVLYTAHDSDTSAKYYEIIFPNALLNYKQMEENVFIFFLNITLAEQYYSNFG
jgi:hypothetical protein